jgi:hypothetical protein
MKSSLGEKKEMKISFKNMLFFLIFIALILSVIIGIQRFKLESDFKQVEMAMSLNKVRELALKEGQDANELLKQLKISGISSIAIHEDTIETLSSQSRIAYLNTNDLTKLSWIHEINFTDIEPISQGELLLVCRDYSLFQRVKNCFQYYLGANQVRETVSEENQYGIKLRGDEEELVKLGLGFSEDDLKKIEALGFNIILRPKNSPQISPEIIQQKLLAISAVENSSLIIFDEEEALGFPSSKMLSETAQFLKENHYSFGIIEFASQEGIHTIASVASELAVRVHSITKEEMETITVDKAIDRWIRAAQERNIRLFYLNPFLNKQEEDLVQQNLTYLESIKNELSRNGYSIGTASLFATYQIPVSYIYILGLGIISAGILLLMEFFTIGDKYHFVFFLTSFIFLLLVHLFAGKIFLVKILALASALIFPVLAMIKNKHYFMQRTPQQKQFTNSLVKGFTSYAQLVKKIIFGITGVMFISLIGGLLISALLTNYQFMLAIQLFSGIKIAYIFPLFLVTLYLWWISKEKKMLLVEDFKRPILFEHALLVFIFLVFVVIYISRSGNFSFLPVPDIEEKMRLLLEEYLVARPRSKEFLIGYPLLSLVIAMNFLPIHFSKYPIMIMGTVAPVTIVNTFCHVHTSLYFSLLRTFHGYWLGILLGIFLASILYLFNKLFRTWLNGNRNE